MITTHTFFVLAISLAHERDFLRAFIPIIFATGAFFMGLLGNLYCETIAFEPQSDTDLPTLLFGKSCRPLLSMDTSMEYRYGRQSRA